MAVKSFVFSALNVAGSGPEPGALTFVTRRNTSTPYVVSLDSDLTTPAENPAEADALGTCGPFYFSDAGSPEITFEVKTANRATTLIEVDFRAGVFSIQRIHDSQLDIGEPEFTGDGATTQFTLTGLAISSPYSALVHIDGGYQPASSGAYDVSTDGADTIVTFSEAPPFGAAIHVRAFVIQALAPGVADYDGVDLSAATFDGGDASGMVVTPEDATAGRTFAAHLAQALAPEDFGAVGDGVTDDGAAFVAWFAVVSAGVRGKLNAKHYVCNSQLACADGASIDLEIPEGAHLDMSGCSPTNDGFITIGTDEDGLIELDAPSANVNKLDPTVTFPDDQGLVEGDLYIVWDDDDFSWLNVVGREYYKSGEYLRVRSTAAGVVTNDTTAFDTYLTSDNIRAVKITPNRVRIWGGGAISFKQGVTKVGLLLWNGYQSNIDDIALSGSRFSNIACWRCYSTRIKANIQDYQANVGLNYGVSIIASFDTWLDESSIHTSRHALTITGGDITASIVNRLCGAYDSTLRGDLMAVDSHGVCEHTIIANCESYGGIDLGGDHGVVEGGAVWSDVSGGSFPGVCVRVREPVGSNFAVRGTKCVQRAAITGVNDAVLAFAVGSDRAGIVEIDASIVAEVADTSPAVRVVLPAASVEKTSLVVNRVNYQKANGVTGDAPTLRIVGQTDSAYKEIILNNVNGLAPRTSNVKCPKITVQGGSVEGSVLDGCNISVLQYSTNPQVIDISGFKTSRNKNGGVVAGGANKTDPVYITVRGNNSLSNAQDGASGSTLKSSVLVANCAVAIVRGNTVGDIQGSPTQTRRIVASSVGELVLSPDNDSFGDRLPDVLSDVDSLRGLAPVLLFASAVAVDHTGDTNEFIYFTKTLKKNLMGANGKLEIRTRWSGMTSSANTKTLRTKLGSTTFGQASITTSVSTKLQVDINNRNSASSQVSQALANLGVGSSGGAAITGAEDTTTDLTLAVTGQLANSGEALRLDSVEVWLTYQP